MKKYLIILALFGVVTTSCADKLNIAPPSNITDEQLQSVLKEQLSLITAPMVAGFNTKVSAISISDVRYTNWWTALLIDNLRGNDLVYMPNNMSWNVDEYRFSNYRGEQSDKTPCYWNTLYARVTEANGVLDLMKFIVPTIPVTETTPAKIADYKKNMTTKATALTLRAWAYYYLMVHFSDSYMHGGNAKLGVPLKLNYNIYEAPLARETSENCWKQIILDADSATMLFKASGINADGSGITPDIQDFDASVSNMILAKAALETGAWSKAVAATSEVLAKYNTLIPAANYIGDENADGNPDYKKTAFTLILDYNPEVFFGFDRNSMSSMNDWVNIFGDAISYGGAMGGYMGIDQRLLSQLGADDIRKKNFLPADREYTYPTSGKKQLLKGMNTKFGATEKQTGASSNTSQDAIVYRVSEALLMKAEAEYMDGKASAAITTLTPLVTARSASALTESGDALLKRIQLEWRIEMWGENGLEYINNKRWNLAVDRVANGPTGTPSSHTDGAARNVWAPGVNFTWQIPQRETNYNPNIVQNP